MSAFDLSTQRLIDIKKIKTFNSLTNLSSIYIMLVKSMTTHKEGNLQHGSSYLEGINAKSVLVVGLNYKSVPSGWQSPSSSFVNYFFKFLFF